MIKYERDLYEPVKTLFESQGYKVKGEVKNCDIAACRGNEIIVCELKLHFNLKLVYQLLERKTASPVVYGAVLMPKQRRNRQNILRLIKEVDCGLIFVSEQTALAEIAYNPSGGKNKDTKKSKRLKKEFDSRSFDNTGGINKTSLMTAYREQSIKLAVYLEALGEASPKKLRALGFSENTGAVLNDNYYGWFSKVKRGVYTLSDLGRAALKYKEYEKQTEFFRCEREEKNVQIIEE
ncbi:MAG: DUF2161 family putative PD-(D/E)XK-type phosphodiesterase [Clostridiales bacterium]|nr:DUF2161 family putative PD-(D/E)XK-type phosphodiesterase [Clostridiales bacterium]